MDFIFCEIRFFLLYVNNPSLWQKIVRDYLILLTANWQPFHAVLRFVSD